MIQKFRFAFAATLLSVIWISGPASAQTLSADRAHGTARYWLDLAGFSGHCMDENLLDKSNLRYLKFGAYIGGYLLGALTTETDKVTKTVQAYTTEGAGGRVHEFNEKGELMAYDVEFTKENCAKLSTLLKASYDHFSKFVLED